ncbi:UNVERIFIED_CONTAM: hypothetical protein RMT77_001862 [Armadillidium vulgare]
MKIKIFKIFFLSIIQTILFCVITYSFSIDDDCLYKEGGVPFSFDVSSPQIDFYIPHNWANNEDNLNHLKIRLFNTNLVLRHPLSTKKDSNDVNLPLNEMKIGWNTIYLNKNGKTVHVEIVKRNSQNFIQNITLLEGNSLFLYQPHIFKDSFHVSGLYSLVNCFKGNPSSYFKIRAKSNFTVPFTLTQGHNRFKVFSESNPFIFELFSSGHKRKVCKNKKRSIYSFTIKRYCDGTEVEHVSEFPENKTYNMHVSTDIFESQDILEYNNSIFTTIVLHNTGNTDFYIEIDFWPPTNAPISLLKGKSSLVWNIMASVFGVLLVLLVVAFVLLYLKYYTRLCIQNHAAREDIDFFPEGLEGYVVSASPQVVVDKSYLARGSSYFGFDKPVGSNAKSPDQNNTEEYHYYERYHPELDQEVKPQYENDFPVSEMHPPEVENKEIPETNKN